MMQRWSAEGQHVCLTCKMLFAYNMSMALHDFMLNEIIARVYFCAFAVMVSQEKIQNGIQTVTSHHNPLLNHANQSNTEVNRQLFTKSCETDSRPRAVE